MWHFNFVTGIKISLEENWVSRVAQLVKNPPAMWETWVWSLGWDDPLERGMATYSNILAWRIAMDRGVWRAPVQGSQRVRDDWVTKHTHRQGNKTIRWPIRTPTVVLIKWKINESLNSFSQFLPSVEFLQQTRLDFRKPKTSSFRKLSTQRTSASSAH